MKAKHETKKVIVLDLVLDIESVIERYSRKGWIPVSYRQLIGKPRSVQITLKRDKPTAH